MFKATTPVELTGVTHRHLVTTGQGVYHTDRGHVLREHVHVVIIGGYLIYSSPGFGPSHTHEFPDYGDYVEPTPPGQQRRRERGQ